MPTSSQEFKSDQITANVTQKPGCSIHLELTISPLATQAAFQKSIKTISKEVSVPGFRKGKAPQQTILKNFGSHVDREWRDLLLNTSFREALQLTKIYPFKEESVSKASIKSISLENGATLVYEYESLPATPSVNPEEITLKLIERKAVEDKDVLQTIENLRLHHAEWSEITDRPAAEGDFVDIDIDAIDAPTHNICKGTRFEIAEGKMGRWMREVIIGMTPGQSAERMSEKEDESDCEKCESGEEHHEHDHFKPRLCKITLHHIKNPTLPPLDDEFAKKFGLESFEELKKRVSEDLNKQADESQVNALRKQAEKAILRQYTFDIPKSLVKAQMEAQIDEIKTELAEQGLEGDDLETESKKIEQDVIERLDRDFRLYFLAQKIADENKIEIHQDDLMQELMRQMALQQSGQSIITKNMDAQEVRSRLYAMILENKAIDYLVEKAKRA